MLVAANIRSKYSGGGASFHTQVLRYTCASQPRYVSLISYPYRDAYLPSCILGCRWSSILPIKSRTTRSLLKQMRDKDIAKMQHTLSVAQPSAQRLPLTNQSYIMSSPKAGAMKLWIQTYNCSSHRKLLYRRASCNSIYVRGPWWLHRLQKEE